MSKVHFEQDGHVGIITICDPPPGLGEPEAQRRRDRPCVREVS
jgi:hypothetical protein